MVFKTFDFLRVNQRFSVITTMIRNCIYEMRHFMVYYVCLVLFMGTAFNVFSKHPSAHFNKLPYFMGNILTAMRITIGDGNFDQVKLLTPWESRVWWVVCVFCVVFGNFIFLNFIIAQISDCYQNVKDRLDVLMYKEKAYMCKEVEDFYTESYKANN